MLKFSEGSYKQVINRPTKELPSYALPKDWISKFANLIHANYPSDPVPNRNDIKQELNNKFKGMNSFQQDNLKTIYAIMSGHIKSNLLQYAPEQNPAIADKLYEGMVYCAEGFDNRINELLQGMFCPVSIDEMMQRIREGIVLKTATSLTNEVHARNRISNKAHTKYGVRAINADDIYTGDFSSASLDDADIEEKLAINFADQYKPISVLQSLEELIREELKLRGYNGELLDDGSYTSEQCTEVIQYLNQLLGTKHELGGEAFLTKNDRDMRKARRADDEHEASAPPDDNDDDDDNHYNIVDLDWITIRNDLINKMHQNSLISHSADNFRNEVTLLDISEHYYVIKYLCTEQEQSNILTNHLLREKKVELFLYTNEQDQDLSPVWLDAATSDPNFLSTIYSDNSNILDTFSLACFRGHTGIVIACLYAAKSNPSLLEKLLGETDGFKLACEHGHTKNVTACLEAAKSNPALLEKLLGETDGFKLACEHGHTKNVTACLAAAKSNPSLLEKLLGETDGFKLACEHGHTELVTACLDAAKSNPALLKQLLVETAGFKLACERGHTELVTAFLDAAKSNPALLEQLLFSTAGFKLVGNRGLTELATACLRAAKNDPMLYINFLSKIYPGCKTLQSTFKEALKKGHGDVAMACLDAAKSNLNLLEELIKLRYPNVGGLSAIFRHAFKKGDDEVAIACLDAVKSNPKRLENLLFGTSLKDSLPPVVTVHNRKQFWQINSLLSGFDDSSGSEHTNVVTACLNAATAYPELLEKFMLTRLSLALRDPFPSHEIVKACLDASKTVPELLKKVLVRTEDLFQNACQRGCIELVTDYLNAAQSTPELLKEHLLTGSFAARSGFYLSGHGNYDVFMLCLQRSDDTTFKQIIDTCPTDDLNDLFEHLITKKMDDLLVLLQKINSENSIVVFKILNKLALPSEIKDNFNQKVINSVKEHLYQGTSEEIINVYRQKASFFSITRLKMFIGFYKDNVEKLVDDLKTRSEKNPFGASTQTLLYMKQFKERLLDVKTDTSLTDEAIAISAPRQ